MIDEQGFRANVGMIICNQDKQVFWAHRIHHPNEAWQFPQGGIQEGETAVNAMYRELHEEIGLLPKHVKILGETQQWISYSFPKPKVHRDGERYIGQKQKWFLLELLADPEVICLDIAQEPEFDEWRWVEYWYPAKHVVSFKRDVYEKVLTELAPKLFTEIA